MSETYNLRTLIKEMTPVLDEKEYVFVATSSPTKIPRELCLFEFKEQEGTTIVLEKSTADQLHLSYQFVASWITLQVHSSLEAIGLTAAFSTELTAHAISCNVVAGYYHDHLFVPKKDGERALNILKDFSENYP